MIDGINYILEFANTQLVGSCSSSITGGVLSTTAADALLANDVYIRTVDVPAGSCTTSVIRIVRVSDSSIISSSLVSINNV